MCTDCNVDLRDGAKVVNAGIGFKVIFSVRHNFEWSLNKAVSKQGQPVLHANLQERIEIPDFQW